MAAVEPTPVRLAAPMARYLAATRPGFLGMTAAGALLGLACAHSSGIAIDAAKAVLTMLFALIAHAGANVLNDYHDARNGSDAANAERCFPYTGGSRIIQNGVLTEAAMGRFAWLLLASVVPAGLWLTWHAGGALLGIGLAGLAIGWAYSAPPFALMSRGLGELAVGAGWLLVVVGADFVQRGSFAALPLVTGFGFALHVAAVLLVNEFPDVAADARAGKRNLVVRLGPARARLLPPSLHLLAHAWLLGGVLRGVLPVPTLLALAAAVPALRGARVLGRAAARPSALEPAIVATIAAALAYGGLVALGLLLSTYLPGAALPG
ncbi:MAG: prenyltransferase [Gammaproteobacteria bacterium]